MAIWIVLKGSGRLMQSLSGRGLTGHYDHASQKSEGGEATEFRAGDVVLIPADAGELSLLLDTDAEWLEVSVPPES